MSIFFTIHPGTETFSSGGAKSTRLATCIQNQPVNSLPVVNRGVKTANFYVLLHTDAPAVLVETAFIDNPDDAKILVEREDDFARAIARGVTNYFQNEKPLPDVVDIPKKSSGAVSSHFNASELKSNCEQLKNVFDHKNFNELLLK